MLPLRFQNTASNKTTTPLSETNIHKTVCIIIPGPAQTVSPIDAYSMLRPRYWARKSHATLNWRSGEVCRQNDRCDKAEKPQCSGLSHRSAEAIGQNERGRCDRGSYAVAQNARGRAHRVQLVDGFICD